MTVGAQRVVGARADFFSFDAIRELLGPKGAHDTEVSAFSCGVGSFSFGVGHGGTEDTGNLDSGQEDGDVELHFCGSEMERDCQYQGKDLTGEIRPDLREDDGLEDGRW